jgi:predicted 2-oxoglutarate/Fe(II)-dependent dioxygenase YbiX
MKFDYFLHKKYLTLENVNQISKTADKYENPYLTDYPDGKAVKTAKVKIINYRYLKDSLTDLVDVVRHTNNKHFGYNLYNTDDCRALHLNEYLPEDAVGYDWHTDGDKNHAQDIKLTVLVNLSKKYTGGEFKLFSCPKINFFDTGDVLIFKSFVPHKVEKITSGKRKTLTLWMDGPCFK